MRDDFFNTVVLEASQYFAGPASETGTRSPDAGPDHQYRSPPPQNGETHPGGLQNFHEGFCDLNIAIYQGTRAPNPEEILSVRVISQQWHLQALGPSRTCGLCATPGVPTLLHTAQSRFGGFWHAALFED